MGWSVINDTDAQGVALILVVVLNWIIAVTMGVIFLFEGQWLLALFWLVVNSTLVVLIWSWGPLFLVVVQRGWLQVSASPLEIALSPLLARQLIWRRIREFGPVLFWIALKAIAIQLLILGIFWGILYLLRTFGGAVGVQAAVWIVIACGAIYPLVLLWSAVRSYLSARKVRRLVFAPGELTEWVFLVRLCSLGDSGDAAKYVRLVRTKRTKDVRMFDRSFVRELNIVLMAIWMGDEPSISAVSQRDLIRAARDGTIYSSGIRSWDMSVLDEVGQLEEFLRRR